MDTSSPPERWTSVRGFEGRYEISDHGRCRSLDFRDAWGRKRPGRVLIQGLDRRGYPRLSLSMHDQKRMFRLHRLVAEGFVSNPNGLPQVNHKDGNKLNNHWTNLEWCTNLHNVQHAVSQGLWTYPTGVKARCFQSHVLVYDSTGQHVDTLAGNLDMQAKGYDYRLVSACIHGKRHTHRGMTFKRPSPSP